VKQNDRYLSQQIDILEKMHELATVAAQNKKLTDFERVNMQLEFEELRKDMNELAGLPRKFWAKEAASGDFSALWGDGSSVVERMRNRIMNGEEWNVREVWAGSPLVPTLTVNDEGVEVPLSLWTVVDDKNANIMTRVDRTSEFVDTGKKVPTVREVLERETSINFMDADSAANGAKLLEQKINDVQKSRDRIAKAAAEQPNKTWTWIEINGLMSHDLKPFFGGIGATFLEHFLGRDGRVIDRISKLMGDDIIVEYSQEGTVFPENKQTSWPASPQNMAATGPLYYRYQILTELVLDVIRS
jgi:hypothetical protein